MDRQNIQPRKLISVQLSTELLDELHLHLARAYLGRHGSMRRFVEQAITDRLHAEASIVYEHKAQNSKQQPVVE